MDILTRLFEMMDKRGISASKLSSEVGISSGLVSQWKKGLQKPSLDVVARIADYFSCSVDYLLGRESGGAPPHPVGILYDRATPEVRAIVDVALRPFGD